MGNIANIKLPVPPQNEQTLIAEYLSEECEKVDVAMEDKKTQLSVMKQHQSSLIFEYVTGKKRVKEVQ